MDASARQTLLQHIAALRAEIVAARTELEGAATDPYGPRIRELEEELEDMQRMITEIRRSIAASSRRRWQRWPVGWIAMGILLIVALLECR